MKNYKILALDPGSNFTGWCFGADGEYKASGVLTLYNKRQRRTIWDRCYLFSGFLRVMIDDRKPDVIGVEWPMGRGGNAAKIKLGMILGIIAAEAGRECITVLEVNPQEVKQTKCSKDNLVYASALAGKEVRKDEADAIGALLVLQGKLFGLSLKEAEAQWGTFWSTR